MDNLQNQFDFLKSRVEHFLIEREWEKYHIPKNVAIAIAIESAELMELFQWDNPSPDEVLSNTELLAKVKDELADILIYVISLGLQLDLDLFDCITQKMNRNDQRFPPVRH